MEQNYVGKALKDACSLPGLFRQNHRKLKDYDRWEAVYTERCTYGFGARQWKPAEVIPQGAIVLAYNLQRENILPSERAFAYKMKLEALKRQGERTDLQANGTSSQLGMKLQTLDIIGQETGESRNQVHRYIRLTNLIPELLDMVDQKQISFNPAVELSYLNPEEQQHVIEAMDFTQAAPSLSQAQRLKKLSQEGRCTLDAIQDILGEVKKGELERVAFKSEQLRRYFPKSYSPKQMQDTIIKLLEQWHRKRQKEQER